MIDAGAAVWINGIEEPFAGAAPDIGVYEFRDYTAVGDKYAQPDDVLKIESIYPNPFNPITIIRYYLGRNMRASVFVVDLQGRKIKSFADGVGFEKGPHRIIWNGTNENGEPVASGVYLLVLRAEGKQSVRKVVLLK